jgi:hypothetical protein
LAIDKVFSIANLVLLSSIDYAVGAAGGVISRDDPDPSVDASANNLAESLYILTGVFAASLAFAKTY